MAKKKIAKKTAPATKKAPAKTVTPKKVTPKKVVAPVKVARPEIKIAPQTSTQKTSLGTVLLWIVALIVVIFGVVAVINKIKSDKMESQAREIIDYLGEMSGGLVIDTWTWKGLGSTGMYEMEFTFVEEGLTDGTEPTAFTSYITKDGKMIYTGDGYLIEDLLNEMAQTTTDGSSSATTSENINKSADPMLSAFIVAHCPYGLQAQKVMVDAIAEAPELADHLQARYFFSSIDSATGTTMSMHGQEEADENLRQICLREEQNNIYWDYVSCYYDEYSLNGADAKTASDTCIAQAGGSTANLNACVADTARGIAYAQIDQDLADQLAVSGSPTLILNDTQTVTESGFGGRTAEGYKNIVCASADNALSFCTATLSSESSTANGSC